MKIRASFRSRPITSGRIGLDWQWWPQWDEQPWDGPPDPPELNITVFLLFAGITFRFILPAKIPA